MSSFSPKIQRSIKVLLVEDNFGDVTLITEVFKASKRPIQVLRARDGQEAMDYLRRRGRFLHAERPDLILLDLNMPRKSGLETLEEIKTDSQLKDIPVVVLTNSKQDSDVLQAYTHQANFYLVKPTELDELFVAMRYVEDIWLKGVLAEAD